MVEERDLGSIAILNQPHRLFNSSHRKQSAVDVAVENCNGGLLNKARIPHHRYSSAFGFWHEVEQLHKNTFEAGELLYYEVNNSSEVERSAGIDGGSWEVDSIT